MLVILAKLGPSGLKELAAVMGVTVPSVRHQMDILEAEGKVGKSLERSHKPGRPRHLFSVVVQ